MMFITISSFLTISIHILRVEDDAHQDLKRMYHVISIHILRVEDDEIYRNGYYISWDISIHILRVEDD